ncbi:MAG: hypothetical protein FWF28_09440 [Micrococcales bacterium]|nr:hypothetical protein [Micrococcales bacterium]
MDTINTTANPLFAAHRVGLDVRADLAALRTCLCNLPGQDTPTIGEAFMLLSRTEMHLSQMQLVVLGMPRAQAGVEVAKQFGKAA